MVLAAIIDAAGMTTALPECHATALSEHGKQLLEELRLLDAMPQVKLTNACVFDRGNGLVANKRGVICMLRCCGGQLDQAEQLRLVGAKRQKTTEADRPPYFEKYSQYDREHRLSTTGNIMRRRAVEPIEGRHAAVPRDGTDGALQHWRRGARRAGARRAGTCVGGRHSTVVGRGCWEARPKRE